MTKAKQLIIIFYSRLAYGPKIDDVVEEIVNVVK